jgi:hypothetical protein
MKNKQNRTLNIVQSAVIEALGQILISALMPVRHVIFDNR